MFDRGWALLHSHVGQFTQRNRTTPGRTHRNLRHQLWVLPPLPREFQRERVAGPPLENHASLNASHRRNGAHHFQPINAVAGELFGPGHNAHRRHIRLPVGAHIDGAGDLPQCLFDLLADRAELAEVVAKHQHRDIGFYAGDEFIDPHLDRLAEAEIGPRHRRRQFFRHPLHQFVARHRLRPGAAGLEHHPNIRLLHAHDVVGDLRTPRLAKHRAHLGKGE